MRQWRDLQKLSNNPQRTGGEENKQGGSNMPSEVMLLTNSSLRLNSKKVTGRKRGGPPWKLRPRRHLLIKVQRHLADRKIEIHLSRWAGPKPAQRIRPSWVNRLTSQVTSSNRCYRKDYRKKNLCRECRARNWWKSLNKQIRLADIPLLKVPMKKSLYQMMSKLLPNVKRWPDLGLEENHL